MNLGYHVEQHNNYFANEIEDLLISKAADMSLEDYNSLVVCFLSHGYSGAIVGSDGQAISINRIQYLFNSYSCPALHNKPKIFIAQACRTVNGVVN